MNKKRLSQNLIKKCVEEGLSSRATIEFIIESLKKRVPIQVSRNYPKFLAEKLLAAGTPPKQVHSEVTWILKEDFGRGMKDAEKRASKIVGWSEPEPYQVHRA
jgi:hypothetical protein